LAPQPQTPIPDADHVLRYIRRKHVDNGVVNGSGFMRRPQEDTPPSVNWMECFLLPIEKQVQEISARRRLKYEKRGLLVRINVGHTRQYVAKNAKDAGIAITLAFLHDPLPAENGKPADDSHAVIDGTPLEKAPGVELVQDLFVDCILNKFEVTPG
jgi:hypothetical protein